MERTDDVGVKDGPFAVRVIWKLLIDSGLCRSSVNDYISRIKRCFGWATENELVSSSVFHVLRERHICGRGFHDETRPSGGYGPIDNWIAGVKFAG